MWGSHRVIRANVLPIPPKFDSSCSSSQRDVAWASTKLWERLRRSRKGDSSALGVAIEFPEDRRLGKGKGKSCLVVWVFPSPAEEDGDVLFLPPYLLPQYCTPPIQVKLHRHDPIPLSLVVLQPVLEPHEDDLRVDEKEISLDDLDLDLSSQPNGTANGYKAEEPIIRHHDLLSLRSSSRKLRVLLTEPVLQGSISSSTRILLTSTPFRPPAGLQHGTDDEVSESSIPRSRLSAVLDEFDPDAFLSSDLTLSSPGALPDGEEDPYVGDEMVGSWSSSSGSLTPRPGMSPVLQPKRPETPPRKPEEVLHGEEEMGGVRFGPVIAQGPALGGEEEAWMGIAGLGRAGIFEGDWVIVRSSSSSGGRLVRVGVYEALDTSDELPAHPLLISPALHRSLFPSGESGAMEVHVSPTPFGARLPTLPLASAITLARIATTEGVDKRYEKSWIRALKSHFSRGSASSDESGTDGNRHLVRRGDIIAVPITRGRPLPEHIPEGDPGAIMSDSDDSDNDDEETPPPTAIAYFIITSMSFEPLVPLEEDFHSSLSSKARAGELGCWVDIGPSGSTRMVLLGLERARVQGRANDRSFHALPPIPVPFAPVADRLRDLLKAAFLSSAISLSILVKGARGAGKTTMIRSLADELGYNVILVHCYDIVGDTAALTEGSIRAALEKASSAAPSIVLLHCVEALATKSDAPHSRPPGIVKVLEDALGALKKSSAESGFPCVLIGTTRDAEKVDLGVAGVFKQELEIGAPNEAQRMHIASACFSNVHLSPEVKLSTLAAQTAALQAIDIVALSRQSQDLALARAVSDSGRGPADVRVAGYAITQGDLDHASGKAREAYSDSIGAPKIPNVRWEDIGGLMDVKREILETIQLPLDHPELFSAGLKKRSGILLYGPPGTGKTLLAKAVATSCSLNFFSVKGPELLNMYVGESEANVRRIFQRARDASPCVVFMDELDSVAPKRGNQGDSGGVMDRIVSQLLAELDGMASGGGAEQVFVMGATNRPDLLDPALLRPGRFDRMIYLSAPKTHPAQADVLRALTRKFTLDKDADLEEVARLCPLNYTGADLYAVASDAMLKAMMRTAASVDTRIAELEARRDGMEESKGWPSPLTPQYYLSRIASPEECEVTVALEDFEKAVEGVQASVSEEEMRYYESVQAGFRGVEGQKGDVNGVVGYEVEGEEEREGRRFEELD